MESFFKTQVQNDLSGVFFNTQEFADSHSINDVDGVACIIDTDMTQALRPGLGRYDGTEKEKIMLFISETEWNKCSKNPPAYDHFVIVDHIRYRIKVSNLFNCMYEIQLEAVE